MKAVVAAFNKEKALVGAFSVITNLRMQLFEALAQAACGAAPNNCDTIWRQYVELCHRVRSMDTSSGDARMTSTRNKYRFCLPGRFNMAGYANHKLYYVYKRYD